MASPSPLRCRTSQSLGGQTTNSDLEVTLAHYIVQQAPTIPPPPRMGAQLVGANICMCTPSPTWPNYPLIFFDKVWSYHKRTKLFKFLFIIKKRQREVRAWRTIGATMVVCPPTNVVLNAIWTKPMLLNGIPIVGTRPSRFGGWQTMVKNPTPQLTIMWAWMMHQV